MNITYGKVEDRYGYTRTVYADSKAVGGGKRIVGEVTRLKHRKNGCYEYRFVPWDNDFLPARASWFNELAARIVARAEERARSVAAQQALVAYLDGKTSVAVFKQKG